MAAPFIIRSAIRNNINETPDLPKPASSLLVEQDHHFCCKNSRMSGSH
uniref:Uncharacterized protein n=1 Tax=Leclercia adecarboxylata TaxID=83655 RepID=A0A7G5F687_9ENTR|nr:hypothetical protein [Leclercia adecarboxylata]